MPVETSWLVEKRSCYRRIFGDVMLEQVTQAVNEAAQWAGNGCPPVYFIVDVTDIQNYPPLPAVMRIMPRSSHPHVAWSVLVVSHPFLLFMGTLLTQWAQMRYHTVSSVPKAIEFLTSRDHTLLAHDS